MRRLGGVGEVLLEWRKLQVAPQTGGAISTRHGIEHTQFEQGANDSRAEHSLRHLAAQGEPEEEEAGASTAHF